MGFLPAELISNKTKCNNNVHLLISIAIKQQDSEKAVEQHSEEYEQWEQMAEKELLAAAGMLLLLSMLVLLLVVMLALARSGSY